MPSPPRRMRLTDELGQPKTPGTAREILASADSPDWLLLGLGPDPAALAAGLPPEARVAWIECPDFEAQAGPDWLAAIPPHWTRLEGLPSPPGGNISLCVSSLRLFPGFWGPLMARLRLPSQAAPSTKPTVLMPASCGRLLRRELLKAFRARGFRVLEIQPGELAAVLRRESPSLFLSVNFDGLDESGFDYHLLRRAGVPVAVWCVDNPFHALSRLKGLFWREIHIFVTDGWFLESLRRHGAEHAYHLPLAACQSFFDARPDAPQLQGRLLFVGRSGFPGRDDYFAGLRPPQELLDEALAMLPQGQRPDYAWWLKRLGCETLWPGRQARLAGLGAELCGQAWRAAVIEGAAAAGPLSVCGDKRWPELARATFELLPPVDYYGPLAGMYASCRCVIGATSPLLPRGLNQRHFDVWAAGGLLLSDDTPGLDIFPADLMREIVFRTPGEIPEALRRLESAGEALRTAWREHIASQHTYDARVETILNHATP
ncbi:glycosyltransferase family protein [Fundidesulfovibrio soli]|uniref:glycosyltransferase family protein n=1 Tax=Fundidesulfovibrio soli TaxID=2922716 RepID=UPI001FAEA6A2|nr:DUF3880 domain-containing protein [Fundidesulfovibrio soli]